MDASIFDSALSHTRRSDASKKKKKIACPLLDVFACGQVSSPRLYRLTNETVFNLVKNDCPDDGEWSSWGEWSHCSQTCDDGTKSRTRMCEGPGICEGEATEFIS